MISKLPRIPLWNTLTKVLQKNKTNAILKSPADTKYKLKTIFQIHFPILFEDSCNICFIYAACMFTIISGSRPAPPLLCSGRKQRSAASSTFCLQLGEVLPQGFACYMLCVVMMHKHMFRGFTFPCCRCISPPLLAQVTLLYGLSWETKWPRSRCISPCSQLRMVKIVSRI